MVQTDTIVWRQVRNLRLPWLVFAIGIGITLLIWRSSVESERLASQTEFELRAQAIAAHVEQRLLAYQEVLYGAHGLFAASVSVSHAEFRNYVDSLHLQELYPGIQGIGYAQLIPAADKARLAAAIRREVNPRFSIWPEGERETYSAIVYLEPFRDRNLRALSYDMLAEPARRAAMQAARDSGEVTASGKVVLVQETGREIQPGFLMYLPLYKKDAPHTTLAERHANIVGWLYVPFRVGDLMHGILGDTRDQDISLAFHDGSDTTQQTLLYTSVKHRHSSAPVFETIKQLHFSGHTWSVHSHSLPAFEARMHPGWTHPALLLGSLISLLLALLSWSLLTARNRALAAAEQMTLELRDSESRYRQMFEGTTFVACLIDPEDGRIVDANAAAAEFWGYSLDELRRMNIADINTAPRAIIQEKMAQVRAGKIRQAEFQHRFKNGEIRDVQIYSGPVTFHGKTLLYSLIHDVTARKRAEAALQASEQRFRDLVNATDGIVWEADATTFVFTFVGKKAESLLGYAIEEWTQPGFWAEHLHPEDQTWAPQFCASCTGRLEPHDFEYRFIAKDGRTVWLRDIVTVVAEAGKPRWLRGIMVDITSQKTLEHRLTQEKALLRTLIDSIPDIIFFKDTAGVYLGGNKALEKIFDAKEASIIGKTDFDFVDANTAAFFRAKDQETLAAGHPRINEEWLSYPDGKEVCLETMKTPYRAPDGQVVGLIGVARDITDRRQREEDLKRAGIVFENVDNGVFITGPDNRILSVNPAFTRITGYSEEDVVGQDPGILSPHRHPATFFAEMWSALSATGTWSGEVVNRRKDGEIYVEWLSITAVKDMHGKVTHYVAVFSDITTRKEDEARVQHLAHYDVLTELPNRALLSDRLHQALAKARREQSKLAVMFLDLDQFKPVNDTLGHDMGDLLLRLVADRLTACVQRESDTVSRLGGDEFVVLLQTHDAETDAQMVAEKILLALHQPFDLSGHATHISTSIGIAVYPEHGHTSEELLSTADIAMYHAKRSGSGRYRFFDRDMRKNPGAGRTTARSAI